MNIDNDKSLLEAKGLWEKYYQKFEDMSLSDIKKYKIKLREDRDKLMKEMETGRFSMDPLENIEMMHMNLCYMILMGMRKEELTEGSS